MLLSSRWMKKKMHFYILGADFQNLAPSIRDQISLFLEIPIAIKVIQNNELL